LIAVSILAILFVTWDYISTFVNPAVLVFISGFVLVFGFLVGIKMMSDL
jgi:hypothetical protein